MVRKTILFLVWSALVLACGTAKRQAITTTSGSHEEATQNDYVLTIKDDVDQGAFVLTLRALGERRLCFDRDLWPQTGPMHFAASHVFVKTGERVFPVKNRNLGYSLPPEYLEVPIEGVLEGRIHSGTRLHVTDLVHAISR